MTTYYHRRWSDGEIINASECDLPLVEVERRWPLGDKAYYDPNPPLAVLQRYEFWGNRP